MDLQHYNRFLHNNDFLVHASPVQDLSILEPRTIGHHNYSGKIPYLHASNSVEHAFMHGINKACGESVCRICRFRIAGKFYNFFSVAEGHNPSIWKAEASIYFFPKEGFVKRYRKRPLMTASFGLIRNCYDEYLGFDVVKPVREIKVKLEDLDQKPLTHRPGERVYRVLLRNLLNKNAIGI